MEITRIHYSNYNENEEKTTKKLTIVNQWHFFIIFHCLSTKTMAVRYFYGY